MTAACPGEDRLAAFALGELAPADAAGVERHLAVCPECASQSAFFDRVVAALRAARPAEAPPGPLAALLAAQAEATASPRRARAWAPVAMAAGVAAIVFLSGFWTGRHLGGMDAGTKVDEGMARPVRPVPAAVVDSLPRHVPRPPSLAFEPVRSIGS